MESIETQSPVGEHADDKIQIQIARSLSEVFEQRDAWQKMCIDPNADIDFYRTIVQSRSEVLRPHVIVLKRNGTVQSILAGRLERKEFDTQFGYKKVRLAAVRCLTLIHGGLLGEESENCVSSLVESVQESLRNREADVAWFYGLDVNSAFYRVARKAGGFLTRDYFPGELKRWKLRITLTYEELYRGLSSNTKHNLKRYSKRLRDTFGDQLMIRSFRELRDLEWVLADTEVIAAKSYHRGLGVGFIYNEETRSTMKLAAKQGWLRAHILYIAGKPCAFWNGVLYGRTFFTSTTAYDPDFRDCRPGTFLLQKMLQELCLEQAADEVDFGFGDAQYKRDWCEQEQLQMSFLLFAPTLKGAYLNCVRTPLICAANGARSVLTKTGALQKVKRAWRDRLVQVGKSSSDTSQGKAVTHPPRSCS
jgi:Acetyltransferase (GNAT) domain